METADSLSRAIVLYERLSEQLSLVTDALESGSPDAVRLSLVAVTQSSREICQVLRDPTFSPETAPRELVERLTRALQTVQQRIQINQRLLATAEKAYQSMSRVFAVEPAHLDVFC